MKFLRRIENRHSTRFDKWIYPGSVWCFYNSIDTVPRSPTTGNGILEMISTSSVLTGIAYLPIIDQLYYHVAGYFWRNHSRRTFQFSKLHFPRFHHIQSPILTPSSFLYSWRKRRREETSIEFRASRKKYLDFTNRRAGKMIFCLIWLKEERREDTKERWRNNKNEESSEGKFIKRCFFAQVPSFSYF